VGPQAVEKSQAIPLKTLRQHVRRVLIQSDSMLRDGVNGRGQQLQALALSGRGARSAPPRVPSMVRLDSTEAHEGAISPCIRYHRREAIPAVADLGHERQRPEVGAGKPHQRDKARLYIAGVDAKPPAKPRGWQTIL
jgi:hypothetical protein